MTTSLVAGAGGMIGGAMVGRLLAEGHEVRAVDIKAFPHWGAVHAGADNYQQRDLRDYFVCRELVGGVDEVYMFAADMGGMGFIERNKFACMMTVRATASMLEAAISAGVGRYFYASSACAYSSVHQAETYGPALAEWMAYPADPEDGYGWEKLFGERLARHAWEDTGIETRVARYHNIYGAPCEWEEPRSKAPAALCRKIAEAHISGRDFIELWGDGQATRSFCYLDDCIEGTRRLMASDYREPLNIGSDELVTVDGLARKIETIAGVSLEHRHDPAAPQGVRGRNSDNTRCREVLGWAPSTSLDTGLVPLFDWVERQVMAHV